MKRIDANTVELTDAERLVADIHSNLMDLGYSQGAAVHLIMARDATLRQDTPVLDAVMTPDFIEWLSL